MFLLFVSSFFSQLFPQSFNTTWIGGMFTSTKAFDVKLEGRFAYVVGWEDDFYGNYFGSFSIIDIQFPSSPNIISSIYINDAYGIDVSGNFAYIAESNAGLTIYDISNPSSPILVGQRMLPSSAKDVKVIGNLAYVADEYAGLRIIDISNPSNPLEIGFFDSPGRSFDVEVRDTIAYLADTDGGFLCINISSPSSPILISEYPAEDVVVDIELKDNLAYYTDGYSGIKVLNISDPNNLELIGSLYMPYWCLGIKISEDYAYVAAWDNGGLRIVDISDSTNLQEVGFYETLGKSRDVDVDGPLAFIADWDGGGLQIINNNLINPLPNITINSPNGGEIYESGSQLNISWNSENLDSLTGINLDYSTDGGYSWHNIISNYQADSSNYDWTTPSSINSYNCLVRICTINTLTICDICDNTFSIIIPNNQITIGTPNGGEIWAVGSNENITWLSDAIANVRIELSLDNGVTWNEIVSSTPSTGIYIWTVPEVLSIQALVKISDFSDTSVFDISNSRFIIGLTTDVNNSNLEQLPERFYLHENYPNPFNPVTLIKYQLPFKSSVTLKIFDILGKEVETLVNEEKDAGYYQISFDASSLSSGIYLYTLQTENYFTTKKMILLK